MLNWLPNGIKTWVVVGVGALVLALSAFFILSNFSPDATFAQAETILYAENGTRTVRTFTSKDPEGATIAWDVTGVDAASFTISNGVLMFVKLPDFPDFEDPGDVMRGAVDLNADGDQNDPGEAAVRGDDNQYQITVRATERRATDYMGPAKWSSTDVTVSVTNEDEDGMVELNRLQPEVEGTNDNTRITATLMDPDMADNKKWAWYKSKVIVPDPNNLDNHWEDASNTDRTSATYTPQADDKDRILLVVVRYSDMASPSGTEDDKMAYAMTANTVRAAVPPADNGSPDFRGGSAESAIAETAMVGDAVDAAITAIEPDDEDTLSYEIDNDATTGITIPEDHDANFFSIDKDSGQIRVAKRLDADEIGEGRTTMAEKGKYVFYVRATDPSGFDDQIEVTVTAKPVNEAPKVMGHGEGTVFEEATDTDVENAHTYSDRPLHLDYTVKDVDAGDAANWSLFGDDAAEFSISGTGAGRAITFKTAPDFEMPMDMNGDNVYKVTVVAEDNDGATGEMAVSITVENVAEKGKVVLTPAQPRLEVPVTASVEDPDGGVNAVSWLWVKSNNAAFDDSGTNTFETIAGATFATYTPTTDAEDDGQFLRVTATYTDATTDKNESYRMEMATTANAVFAAPGAKVAPEFPAGSITREVSEFATGGDAVGDPVTATDPDSSAKPEYSLGGNDAPSFDIDMTSGQITLDTNTELDYETKQTYDLEVTATDGDQNMTTVPVTLTVTDVEEAPEFADASMDMQTYEENGTGPVGTYMARDPEDAGIDWDVMGADADDFTITNGMLMFKESPDFENPHDADTKNDYSVTLMVSEMRPTGYTGVAKSRTFAVTVTVTNMNEPGTVDITQLQPQIGTPITASLMDLDGTTGDRGNPVITTGNYVWFRSTISGTPDPDNSLHWENAGGSPRNVAEYTPVAPEGEPTDEGKFLMAEVTYPEEPGETRIARGVTAYRVRAAPDTNGSPDFQGGSAERKIHENAMVGDDVGAAVTAREPDSDDVVTYYLEGVDANQGDDDFFSINKRTGQIMVADTLDHESGSYDRDGEYVVTVVVRDPSNDYDMITVTITATNVNESPSVMGRPTIMLMEDGAIDNTSNDKYHFSATDPDTLQSVNWSLEGEDRAVFQLSGTLTGRGLNFREKPDYEMPADANGDNVYKVSVVATDNGASPQTGEIAVRITVANMEEDGELTLDSEQPTRDTPLEATLIDPDGVDHVTSWQWERSPIGTETEYSDITGATGHIYTPTGDDNGKYLRVTVVYRDGKNDDSVDTTDRTLVVTTANAVLGAPAETNVPTFAQSSYQRMVAENTMNPGVVGAPVEAMDPDGDALTYSLDDDSGNFALVMGDHDDDVGTDPVETGQIIVAEGTEGKPVMLDYEDQRTYMVELTAEDESGLKAMVMVTITLMDMNEMPGMPMELMADLVISGPPSPEYEENGTAVIGTYSAAGANAASTMWSLSGDDRGGFSIDSSTGELMFATSPDYEMPMDADMDNMYEITVMGNDGTNPAVGYDVIVAVTNMDERGEVTLWDGMDALTMAPQVDDTITGAVMDPDGDVTGETWQWAKTMDTANMSSWMDIQGATNAAYMVTEGDTGYYLRVMATYTDGEGMGKMASEETMMVGAEAGDPLLAKYDGDKDGWIQLEEARDAVGDYFGPPKGEKLSLDDTRKVVGLYFLYKNRQQ